MVLPQRSICLSIKDSKMVSVATKVLYRATLNPFLSYSARYRNNRVFFHTNLCILKVAKQC